MCVQWNLLVLPLLTRVSIILASPWPFGLCFPARFSPPPRASPRALSFGTIRSAPAFLHHLIIHWISAPGNTHAPLATLTWHHHHPLAPPQSSHSFTTPPYIPSFLCLSFDLYPPSKASYPPSPRTHLAHRVTQCVLVLPILYPVCSCCFPDETLWCLKCFRIVKCEILSVGMCMVQNGVMTPCWNQRYPCQMRVILMAPP